MNRTVKYLLIRIKKIDVSPFAKRNIFNPVLYLFAGASILIFIGKDSPQQNYFYKDQIGQTICSSVEKFIINDFTFEKFDLINPNGFIIFSSYSDILILKNFPQVPKVRGPPVEPAIS